MLSSPSDDEVLRWKLLHEAAAYIRPRAVAIYGVELTADADPGLSDFGENVGSGTAITVRGTPYLLTAAHVAASKNESQHVGNRRVALALSNADTKEPTLIRAPYIVTGNPLDLALVRLDADALAASRVQPVEASCCARSMSEIDRRPLFIVGYPGEWCRQVPIAEGGVAEQPIELMTFWRSEMSLWDDSLFAIDVSQSGLRLQSGQQMDLGKWGGVSGSGVWISCWRKEAEGLQLEEPRLVGVVHRWDKDAQVLIATRIEAVRSFVLRAVRQESAYYRWLGRGRVIGDPLTDWLAAEQDLVDLS